MVTRSGGVAAWDENGFSHVNPEEAVRRIGKLMRNGRVVLLAHARFSRGAWPRRIGEHNEEN